MVKGDSTNMDFLFDEKQEMLKKISRSFFEQECPKSLVREAETREPGYSKELYLKMAEIGWLGLGIPEKYGGNDGDIVDLFALYEEMGRALVPGPHLVSAVVCAQVILNSGSEEQKMGFLPKIAGGQLIMTLALYELDGGYSASSIKLPATRENHTYDLEGTKLFVPYANIADYFICAARTIRDTTDEIGIGLFLVQSKSPSIQITPLLTLGGDNQGEVTFRKAKRTSENLIGSPDNGWMALRQSLHRANVLQCAEMVGGAQKALEMAVDYAKQRVQFGRPIGAFQAIQHKCADMLTALEGGRYLAYKAACRVRDGQDLAPEVAMAKALSSASCRRVCKEAHQIFAGAGLMAEHDLNLYYRRNKAIELNWGDADYQVREVAKHYFSARQLASILT